MMIMVTCGIYQHYKGPYYYALGLALHAHVDTSIYLGEARHSETGDIWEVYVGTDAKLYVRLVGQQATRDEFMVYVPLYPHKGPGMAVRPLPMFREYVKLDDERTVPRFRFVGQSLDVDDNEAALRLDEAALLIYQALGPEWTWKFARLKHLLQRPDTIGIMLTGPGDKQYWNSGVNAVEAARAAINRALKAMTEHRIETIVDEGPEVDCLFNGQGDFINLADNDTREPPPGSFVRAIPKSILDEVMDGNLRILADGTRERVRHR